MQSYVWNRNKIQLVDGCSDIVDIQNVNFNEINIDELAVENIPVANEISIYEMCVDLYVEHESEKHEVSIADENDELNVSSEFEMKRKGIEDEKIGLIGVYIDICCCNNGPVVVYMNGDDNEGKHNCTINQEIGMIHMFGAQYVFEVEDPSNLLNKSEILDNGNDRERIDVSELIKHRAWLWKFSESGKKLSLIMIKCYS